MKKSESLKKQNNFLQKVPVARTILKKWNFYKSVRESLKWHHDEHDIEELAKNILPESEKIEIHCAWVTEMYAPSNIDILIKSLKNLGWDKPVNDMGNKFSLAEWIKQCRSFGNRSSWMNGGIICSSSDNTRFLGEYKRCAKLPLGVDYARLSIQNKTSSLTLITIQFVFNDDIANSLNKPFNDSYRTKVIYRPSLLRIKVATYIGVIEQKMQAIKGKLDEIHTSLYSWLNDNLPGHYSFSGAGAFPTVDLITSRIYKQPEENGSHLKDHYTDLIFDCGLEVWKCKDDANLELRLPWRSTEKPIAVLFGNYDKLTKDTESYGGKDRSALTAKLQMAFDVTMGLWATHNLLLSYEQQLSAIRDRVAFQIKGTRAALKNLDYIQHHFLLISTDTQAIGNDAAALVKAKRHYSTDALDFDPPHYLKNASPTFVEFLRQQDEMRTEQLIKLESRVNETITSSGNLTSTIANLRIQRNVFWFTFIVAILTLFSIFKNDPLLQEIQQRLTYLTDLIKALLQKL